LAPTSERNPRSLAHHLNEVELRWLLTSLFRRDGNSGEPLCQSLAEPTATDSSNESGAVPAGWQGGDIPTATGSSNRRPVSQGVRQPTGTDSTPEKGQQPEPDRHQLTPCGHRSVWQQVSGLLSAGPVSTVRSATPAQHAAAILDFLQAPGGRTGAITAKELRQIHAEVCFVLELEPIGWTAVGRELRKLIGEGRTYQRSNGEQLRVYHIPRRPKPDCFVREFRISWAAPLTQIGHRLIKPYDGLRVRSMRVPE
jgi:hypothetical protein